MKMNVEVKTPSQDQISSLPLPAYKYSTNPDLKTSRIMSVLGMSIIVFMFTAWMPYFYFLITGGLYMRLFLIVFYIFQLSIKRKNRLFINFIRKCKVEDYFKSYTLLLEEELEKEKVLICSHPHGVISSGTGITSLMLNDEKLYVGVAPMLLNLPLSGLFARLMGFRGVDNKTFKDMMKRREPLLFLPGGFECATITRYGQDRVFIKQRYGFIKYALQYGYKVYPCYIFNENKVFYTFKYLEKLRIFMNKIKLPGVFFLGQYLMFPFRDVDICTVVGKSISLPQIDNPTKEDVKKYHSVYIDALKDLFNRYKHQFGASQNLEIL